MLLAALALVTALTSVCCLGLCVRHRGHGLDGWHVLMGLAVVAMLLAPGRLALLQIAVFALGAAWCAAALVARSSSGHARLLVGCTAMVAMLAPSAFSPASASMPGMAGMAMTSPAWLTTVLVVALGGVAVAALRAAVTTHSWMARLGVGCEAVMAVAMAALVI